MYYSEYSSEFLETVARALQGLPNKTDCWVIFDNTAAGHALGNATELMGMVGAGARTRPKGRAI
jgi:uncharacterized protein YecE (DUF72 family)